MIVEEVIKRAIELCQKFDNSDDGEEIDRTIGDLLTCCSSRDARRSYWVAQLAYVHPDKAMNPALAALSELGFRAVLAQSVDARLTAESQLMLGHIYFDNRRFREASHEYERIEVQDLPEWLQPKLLEHQFVCAVRLEQPAKAEKLSKAWEELILGQDLEFLHPTFAFQELAEDAASLSERSKGSLLSAFKRLLEAAPAEFDRYSDSLFGG
jgi:hypothetical protein